MIAVFAAMSRELAGLERRLAGCERAAAGECPLSLGYWCGKRVLLCRTGIGKRAEGVVRAVLEGHRPSLVLSVGVCGALDPKLSAGDLVLCQTVQAASSVDPHAVPVHSDEGLLSQALAAAEAGGIRVRVGQSLTVDRVIGEPAEKEALRESGGLDVVEMESYWVGMVARESGLPFLTVRVVLDEQGDTLPRLPGVVQPDGSERVWRALPHALKHPGQVPRLLSMAVSERRALGNLTRFLEAFVGAFKTLPVAEPA